MKGLVAVSTVTDEVRDGPNGGRTDLAVVLSRMEAARAWVAGRSQVAVVGSIVRRWAVYGDEDGSLSVVPDGANEPPASVGWDDGFYTVTVCDPKNTQELGPFSELNEALDSFDTWLGEQVETRRRRPT